MHSKIENIVKHCSTCREHKYDRHPTKPQIQETPIPQSTGEIAHIDIYSTEKKLILTAIDKRPGKNNTKQSNRTYQRPNKRVDDSLWNTKTGSNRQ
ncbi:unnamed protein product [Ceratitis capitata]|uniref:(Mediterranean fruit fly) hypothetical protein n=1 Tax=Ceratitis capitata TaxID=7213 RepID=A0A811UVX6_CERCA|nr:unnamed protein product [Ceratitis capitata]